MKVRQRDVFALGQEGTIYLNSAALTPPLSGEIPYSLENYIGSLPYKELHKIATRIVEVLTGVKHILLTRNTTEAYAFSVMFLTRGRVESTNIYLPKGRTYVSIHDASLFEFNYARRGSHTTYSTFEPIVETQESPLNTNIIYYDQSDRGLVELAIKKADYGILVLESTSRCDGMVDNIMDRIGAYKDIQESFHGVSDSPIIVDAAQGMTSYGFTASLNGLGFDAGCVHKGGFASQMLGFCAFPDQYKNDIESFISTKEQFQHLDVNSSTRLFSIPRESLQNLILTIWYFIDNHYIDGIDFNDLINGEVEVEDRSLLFKGLIEKRRELYSEMFKQIKQRGVFKVLSSSPHTSNGYIFSFMIDPSAGMNFSTRGLADQLIKSGFAITYIDDAQVIRVSFGINNTMDEVEQFCSAIDRILEI